MKAELEVHLGYDDARPYRYQEALDWPGRNGQNGDHCSFPFCPRSFDRAQAVIFKLSNKS